MKSRRKGNSVRPSASGLLYHCVGQTANVPRNWQEDPGSKHLEKPLEIVVWLWLYTVYLLGGIRHVPDIGWKAVSSCPQSGQINSDNIRFVE